MLIDARIPVHFTARVPETGRDDQVLILPEAADMPPGDRRWASVARLPDEQAASADAHPPGCSCCAPRRPAAIVLTRLFQARARGEVGFFRSVVASLPPLAANPLRETLRSDSMVAACYVEAKATE